MQVINSSAVICICIVISVKLNPVLVTLVLHDLPHRGIVKGNIVVSFSMKADTQQVILGLDKYSGLRGSSE